MKNRSILLFDGDDHHADESLIEELHERVGIVYGILVRVQMSWR